MSSITITLTGDSSSLNANFCPEIELDERYAYSCCLLGFFSYNSIHNVNESNNKLYYKTDANDDFDFVSIPIGAYEIDEVVQVLNTELTKKKVSVKISADSNTMKSTCTVDRGTNIDFTKFDCIGALLGFNKRKLAVGSHKSDKLIDILHVNNLRIDCDLITGSFQNGTSTHTIYEFVPTADPGYKINEQPKHLIYLPVVRQRINTINVSILDQNGEFVNFRGETITCRIHIKRDV